jgi:hypothetical protein
MYVEKETSIIILTAVEERSVKTEITEFKEDTSDSNLHVLLDETLCDNHTFYTISKIIDVNKLTTGTVYSLVFDNKVYSIMSIDNRLLINVN